MEHSYSCFTTYHRFLANPEVVQTVFRQLIAGKQQRTFVIILSPVVQIPIELEKLFVVIEHALPDRNQLQQILEELTQETPGDRPAGSRTRQGPGRSGRSHSI